MQKRCSTGGGAGVSRLYVGVGPVNYGWYQCELHAAAKRIFDDGGDEVLRRFWELLPAVSRDASDGELAYALQRVHPETTRTLAEWPTT